MRIPILSDTTVSSFQNLLRSENKAFFKLYLEGFDLSKEEYRRLFTSEELLLEDIIISGENLEKPILLTGGPTTDFENSKRIFEWLKGLSLADANDKRLWISLAHMDYQDYTRERWKITKDTQPKVFLERYYYEGSGLSSRLRNSIARLWWIPRLTYVEGLEDPYEFTRIVWSSQDLMQGLFERTYGTNKNVRFGMLRFFRDRKDNYDSKEFRVFYKELNALGATKSLLLMEEGEVYDFLKDVEKLYFPDKVGQGNYSLPFEKKNVRKSPTVVFDTSETDALSEAEDKTTETGSPEIIKKGNSRVFYLKRLVPQDIERTPSLSRTAAENFFRLKLNNGSSTVLKVHCAGSVRRVMVNKRNTREEYRIFLNHIKEVLNYHQEDILRFEELSDGFDIKLISKKGDTQTYNSYDSYLEGKDHTIVQGNMVPA